MKLLKELNDVISKIENFLLVFFILLMILLSFSQVILRNFFSIGLNWADIGLRNMVLWVSFIGASLAANKNRHITIDVVTKFLPLRWKTATNIVTNGFSFLVTVVFIWASARFVLSEYEAKNIAFLGVYFWMLECIIPMGFFFISIRFFLKVVEDIQSFR